MHCSDQPHHAHPQLGYELGAVDMLLELVRDNQRVLDRISDQQIESFIYWLKRTRDPAFLKFLEALCVCEKMYEAGATRRERRGSNDEGREGRLGRGANKSGQSRQVELWNDT